MRILEILATTVSSSAPKDLNITEQNDSLSIVVRAILVLVATRALFPLLHRGIRPEAPDSRTCP